MTESHYPERDHTDKPDVGDGQPFRQLLRDGRVQSRRKVHDGGLALREVHREVVAGVLEKKEDRGSCKGHFE